MGAILSTRKRMDSVLQGGFMDAASKPSGLENVQKFMIYHRVYENEGFEESAETLYQLVEKAVSEYPEAELHLVLEIEGHKGEYDGFDWDMFELQTYFVLEVLMRHLTTATTPLCKYGHDEKE